MKPTKRRKSLTKVMQLIDNGKRSMEPPTNSERCEQEAKEEADETKEEGSKSASHAEYLAWKAQMLKRK